MAISSHSYLVFFIFSHLLSIALAQEEESGFNSRCQPFNCGNLGSVGFPFSNLTNPECGFWVVSRCNELVQMIQLGKGGSWFYITTISQDNTVTLQENKSFVKPLDHCGFMNLTLPSSPFFSVEPSNQSLFRCPQNHVPENYLLECKEPGHSIVYKNSSNDEVTPPNCSFIKVQENKTEQGVQVLNLYTGWFRLRLNVTRECRDCYFQKGGQCQLDNTGNFNCANPITGEQKFPMKIGLGLGIGIGGLMILIVVLYIIRRFKRRKYTSPSFNSRYISSDPSSKSELDVGSVYFGVPIFSYTELAEATNNFNQEKEVGDGGFGTVYYAKLQDGREVAVKRFYENNYRRLEQFMNEIEILTLLRHKNLVSLYGCTSRHSQQGLLLVYEFIPNGTVADHLRGDRSKPSFLTWPVRMNIAIETASALAYLHSRDIIHRDVKTNNILLDDNFSVKVADFGLSRLFPTDVTHVSTAPQGSPGYVDPEYYQCYQLTNKSDVYSFGVVLIELISSMPAVDMNRHRLEINLANLAINRIQNCAIDELIDPCLGYQSDEQVKRMVTSVAELAFLCLQQNKEMRPSMDEVLEELKRIENGQCKMKFLNEEHDDNEVFKSMQPVTSPPDCDEATLLNNIRLSPVSVTTKWASSDTTSSISY